MSQHPPYLFLIFLLLLEALYAGSEIALLSCDKLLLKNKAKNGSHSAKLTLELLSHPEHIFSVTLLVTIVCVTTLSTLIELHFSRTHGHAFASLLTLATASPLVVVFGELLPKTLSRLRANQLATRIAPLIYWTYWGLYPFTRTLSAFTARLSSLITPIEEILAGKRLTTRDELRTMVNFGSRATDLKNSERTMIKRIFDFKDTEAKHALIPLVRVRGIDSLSTVSEALDLFRSHRHSRMPVYEDRIDNIIGVLELSDLYGITDIKQPIQNYISNVHYISETHSLEGLLLEMRRENDEMVVVVDEYGGAVGILTFEDIVEEIVGEIKDEYETESSLFKELAKNKWLIQAKMEVQLLNEHLHLEIPEGDYETLAGFLLQQFGRIPEVGYELYFDTPRGLLKFTIRKANARQIESVTIEVMPSTVPQ